mgnify:CR=1 FL=1
MGNAGTSRKGASFRRGMVYSEGMAKGGIRLGLCCIFRDEPIRFRRTTATALLRMPRRARMAKLSEICLHNARALLQALDYCAAHGIGGFRVNSQVLPLKTHPVVGYDMTDLPGGREIIRQFRACGRFARAHGLRTSLHPDQFVILNSPRPDVVESSLRELEYQAEVASWIGADVINLHGGGAYGDKRPALERLLLALRRLPKAVRSRLTLENDDRVYTPEDLLPVCRAAGIPLVYDVHHHRCLPDRLGVEEATMRAMATWDREPLFHISSPLAGWGKPGPHRHHDYIDPKDFPACWLKLKITVEVEAKAKERAVLRLKKWLDEEMGTSNIQR